MICTTTEKISILMGEMYLHARMFCALAHTSSIPMGLVNFYMQEHFLHSLIRLLYPCLRYIYLQECSVHSPLCLLFPWCNVRAWNLFWASVVKPVLWQLMILLPCILAHKSSIPMGALKFYMQQHFLHSLIRLHQFFLITPILTLLTEVWPVLIEPWLQIIRPC